MKAYLVIAILAIAVLSGCEQLQRAAGGLAVYQAISSPAVPLQDKACAVIAWGVPIAQERAAKGTLTARQITLADGAARAAQAYCAGHNLAWRDRASAAADELALVLWDLVK